MIALALLAAAMRIPPGLDPSHIPMGSPLGAMPILVSPGESPAVLRKPMTEEQWFRQQRARIAQENRQPWARALARRMAENERAEAQREAADRAAGSDPR